MRISRRFAWLNAVAALAVALALFPAMEVTATDQIEINGDGVVHGGFYSDQFWASDFDALAAATGTRVTFGGTFHSIDENDGVTGSWSNTREMLNQVWQGKATPFASVTIPDTAAAIARGDHDAKISEWATHLEQYLSLGGGRAVIIAPLQEANGTWTPYACDPTSFKVAYRRFVDLIRDRGIDETQVRFAFAPNGWTPPGCGTLADYYPGDAYVDVMGFSGYNGGTCLSGSNWQSVADVVDPYVDELAAINATKPIVVAQTASPRPECGGDQEAWARDLYAHLAADRRVVGVIWFNIDTSSWGEFDWRIWDG
ncbi:MAG: glycosyl hydrolase, partial [Actinomycetota bacterium]|nr:glycosyl hydrolase [Actinomycetota bacterium]